MKKIKLFILGVLSAFPATTRSYNNYQNSYQHSNTHSAKKRGFNGIWLELGGGFESDKLSITKEKIDYQEHCKVKNGLFTGKALFCNVSDNNFYNAFSIGFLVNSNTAKDLDIKKWQEKYATQIGLELGIAFANLLMFSSINGLKAKDQISGYYGAGIGLLLGNIQLRGQIAYIKGHSKTDEAEYTAKNKRLATIFSIVIS